MCRAKDLDADVFGQYRQKLCIECKHHTLMRSLFDEIGRYDNYVAKCRIATSELYEYESKTASSFFWAESTLSQPVPADGARETYEESKNNLLRWQWNEEPGSMWTYLWAKECADVTQRKITVLKAHCEEASRVLYPDRY